MKTLTLGLTTALVAATLAGAAQAATPPAYEMRIMAPGIKPETGSAPAAPQLPAPPVGIATGLLEAQQNTSFGSVWVGLAESRLFRFTNIGNAPATALQAQVAGEGLSLTASSCGTAAAPVTLAAGVACEVTIAYQPTSAAAMTGTVSIAGAYSNATRTMALSGQGYLAAMGTLTADSGADFGAVALSGSASRSFTLTNSGNLAATGVAASITPTIGLSISANTCGTPASPGTLAAGASCSITLTYGGSTASRLSGVSLDVAGSFAAIPESLALAGSLGGFDVVATWSSSSSSTIAPTAAFLNYGQQTTGTVTTKDVTIRSTRTSGGPAVGFTLSGDVSQFNISRVITHNGASTNAGCPSGGIVAANRLSSTPCVAIAYPNIVLSIQYAPTVVGSHQIVVTPNTNNGTILPGALTFSGASQFNPSAAWSTSVSSVVAPSSAALAYGTKLAGSATVKTFYLKNTGTNGPLSLGFTLSGDAEHFKITRLDKTNTLYSASPCNAGGVIAADKRSTTACQADDATVSRSIVQVQVTYQPLSTGNHSVAVTPLTNNGTVLPAAITLTGTVL
jgi:hypothetical protein